MLCQHNSTVLEHNCEFDLTYLFQNTQLELSNKITKKIKIN